MKIDKHGIHIDNYDLWLTRFCIKCKKKYHLCETHIHPNSMYYPPVNYIMGCEQYCLSCWLCLDIEQAVIKTNQHIPHIDFVLSDQKFEWFDQSLFQDIDQDNIELAYHEYIKDDFHLCIFPITRLFVDRSIFLPNGLMIYPIGRLNLSSLKLKNIDISNEDIEQTSPQDLTGSNLASLQSKLAGITIQNFEEFALIVFPIKFQWNILNESSHEKQLEFISNISEAISNKYFNFIKYHNCNIEDTPNNNLPGFPSQTNINNMSASLFINYKMHESKLIGGAIYSHGITKGLGLVLSQPEWDIFPKLGEVGNVVNHALSLYSQIIQTESSTSRFVQALSLLEFLAFPQEYKPFKEVKKIIARYLVPNTMSQQYQDLLNRFEELTGKKDQITDAQLGYRTRIVHIGSRLEDILPQKNDRKKLFEELNSYIKCVLEHMIEHSNLTWENYILSQRQQMR